MGGDSVAEAGPEVAPVEDFNEDSKKDEVSLDCDNLKSPEHIINGKIKDQSMIDERVDSLPASIRKVLEEKFRAQFVSIEEIDTDQLI